MERVRTAMQRYTRLTHEQTQVHNALDMLTYQAPPASTASTAVDCDVLGDIDKGFVHYSSTLVGASARYFCHTGHMLIGNLTQNCQEDGVWSGVEPQCNSKWGKD